MEFNIHLLQHILKNSKKNEIDRKNDYEITSNNINSIRTNLPTDSKYML